MTPSPIRQNLVKAILKLRPFLNLLYVLFFWSLSNSAFAQLFNTPGSFTYTVPDYSGPAPGPNETLELVLEVTIVGAGGGGGRGDGAGGGGGGEVKKISLIVNEGDNFTGFIGTGGTGRSGSNGPGLAGTATMFDVVESAGGLGGLGGDAGNGGASGSGIAGGTGINNSRSAGGGGGGAAENGGNGGNGVTTNSRGIGGDGGLGVDGFAGGGGGAGKGNGGINSANHRPGNGRDGGSNGSTRTALNANNGGGGGGGWTAGGRGGDGLVLIDLQARILPVEYLSLNATFKPEERASEISWTTAKEWENSHFEIERSIGQVKEFVKIGEVEGAGYSDDPVEYSFKDSSLPLSGGIAYYRLKQVDFNGNFQYSDVLSVRIPSMQVITGVWRAYPNPTKGNKLTIDLVNAQEYTNEKITARLVSSLVGSSLIEGKNIREVSDKLSDKLQASPNGLYIIEVYWGEKREYLKVLKN